MDGETVATAIALLIVIGIGVFDVVFLWVCGGGARAVAMILAAMVLASLWGFGAIITAVIIGAINAIACWESGS